MERSNTDRSIVDLDQAIRLDPKNAQAFNNRGFAYRNKRDIDRAIQDLNEAIKINPAYAIAFYNRGNAYYDKREIKFERGTSKGMAFGALEIHKPFQ